MSASGLLTLGLGSFGSSSHILTLGLGAFSSAVAPRPTRWQKLAGSDELCHMWEGSSEKQVSLVGTDEIMHQWEGGAR